MKFSAVIPVYNKAETIAASIDSILAQTVSDVEIVIVDDGSSDDLDSVLANYSNLTVVHQPNGGVSVARNTGIDHAKGDYICFLDADDLWMPHHLETISELMKKYPGCEYFLTSHIIESEGSSSDRSSEFLADYEEDFLCDDLLGLLNSTAHGILHTNSVCIKKTVFDNDQIRFEPGIRIGEDTDVWFRSALKRSVAVSKADTTVYRREFSTATRHSFYIKDWIFSLREEAIMDDADITDRVKTSVAQMLDRYRLTGSRECMLQCDRKGAKRLLAAVHDKSGKRYWLSWLFSCLPYSVCEWAFHMR